jgi:hypothetical protein
LHDTIKFFKIKLFLLDLLRLFPIYIANARQIFQNKVFFSLPGEVFLIKKKKKVFSEKFAGRQQYIYIYIYLENLIVSYNTLFDE